MHRQTLRIAMAIAILICQGIGVTDQSANAIAPDAPDAVVEILPASNQDPALRRAARDAGNDLSLASALPLAQRYFQRLRLDSDPHLAGRAEALLLRPGIKAHPAARLLLADLYQHQHKFERSQALLQQLLSEQPEHQSALILSANVYRVQGDLQAAQRACERAARVRETVITLLCAADIQQLKSGGDAYALVSTQLASGGHFPSDPTAAIWLADLAARSGRPADAERHFREALVLGTTPYGVDRYVRFLLKTQQPFAANRVVEWWAGRQSASNALTALNRALVGHALAEAGELGVEQLSALADEFDSRWGEFEEALGPVHWRELARFALVFDRNHATALKYASRNWAMQKEPIDALLLARAAHRHGDAETSRQLRQALEKLGMLGVSGQLQAAGLI